MSECPVPGCPHSAKTHPEAVQHRHTHPAFYPEKCLEDDCPEIFKTPGAVKQHMKWHGRFARFVNLPNRLGEQPILHCEQCPFTTVIPGALATHEYLCTAGRLSCPECGMKFTRNVLLKAHKHAELPTDIPSRVSACKDGTSSLGWTPSPGQFVLFEFYFLAFGAFVNVQLLMRLLDLDPKLRADRRDVLVFLNVHEAHFRALERTPQSMDIFTAKHGLTEVWKRVQGVESLRGLMAPVLE